MADHYVPEHKRYAQRLAELEEKSSRAHKQQQAAARKPITKRMPRLRWHHYKKNGERVIVLVLLFGAVLALMLYIISPLSKVKSVTVVGNNSLDSSQVERATRIYPGRFIWGVVLGKKDLCRQARFRQPQIDHVSVQITGPQSVKLRVSENALIGTARLGQKTYAVLADGRMQETETANGKTVYRSFNHHRTELRQVAKQLGGLKPAIRNDISAVNYTPTKTAPQKITLYMSDGNTVLANAKTVGKKMAYYPAIAANMKQSGVIDLQVGAYSYNYGSSDK